MVGKHKHFERNWLVVAHRWCLLCCHLVSFMAQFWAGDVGGNWYFLSISLSAWMDMIISWLRRFNFDYRVPNPQWVTLGHWQRNITLTQSYCCNKHIITEISLKLHGSWFLSKLEEVAGSLAGAHTAQPAPARAAAASARASTDWCPILLVNLQALGPWRLYRDALLVTSS